MAVATSGDDPRDEREGDNEGSGAGAGTPARGAAHPPGRPGAGDRGRRGAPVRRPGRGPRVGRARRAGAAPAVVVTMAAFALGCAPAGPPPAAGCAPGAPPVSLPAGSPWATTLCRQLSQKPPASVNGVLYRDGVLWLASLSGGEMVAADPTTGEIIGRFGPAQGVTTGPDDLVMTDDGTIYWTGQANGDIGVLTPHGRSRTLTNLGVGVNPIVLAPDGQLLIGRAYTAKGLYRVNPTTGASTTLNPDLAINGSALAADGTTLFSPTTSDIPAHIVRIDTASGGFTTINRNAGIGLGSVKIPPATRGEQAGTLYALQPILPAAVHRIDSTTGRTVARDIPIPLTVADNMTFAPDGRLFVTNQTPAKVAVVDNDGRTHTVAIGRA